MRTRIVVLLLSCFLLCGTSSGAVGLAEQDVWINQGAITDLAGTITFIQAPGVDPDETHTRTILSWDGLDIDAYLSSTYGWITPPATGDYYFYIASDDENALFLSADENDPTGDYICSVESGWTGFESFSEQAAQKSAAISLVAGNYYKFYTTHREGSGGDHESIAWTGPGIDAITVISSDYIRNNADMAGCPEPIDDATDVKSSVLSWFEPVMVDALTYNVTIYADPNIEYTGIAATELDLGALAYATEYKWRVDAVEADGITIHKGVPYTFTTNDGTPFYNTQPLTTQVKEGETATFTAAAESIDPSATTIEWFKVVEGGDDVSVGTGPQLDIENVVYADKADFYCVATNAIGATTSNTVTMYVTRGLVHRFSFDDPNDYVGGVEGVVVAPNDNVSFANGQAVFTDNNVYFSNDNTVGHIDLPNGMISSLGKQMTIITWFTWAGPDIGQDWQRVFDFGTSDGGEGTSPGGGASNYMFLTPCSGSDTVRFGYTNNLAGTGERTTNWHTYAPIGTEICVALTWDEFTNKTYMYVNGALVSQNDLHVTLEEMIDNNNWIGRAQWNDRGYNGSINEMRFYDEALTDGWIAEHYNQGPDTIPTNACTAPPAADVDGDCYVNMTDLGIMASEWLDCGWIVCE